MKLKITKDLEIQHSTISMGHGHEYFDIIGRYAIKHTVAGANVIISSLISISAISIYHLELYAKQQFQYQGHQKQKQNLTPKSGRQGIN